MDCFDSELKALIKEYASVAYSDLCAATTDELRSQAWKNYRYFLTVAELNFGWCFSDELMEEIENVV